MNFNVFNNPDVVNIFTDGSMYMNTHTRETIGCAGALIVDSNKVTTKYTQILRDSTNNECEIYSIILGIDAAARRGLFNGTNTINLFSDSQICIKGLKEWSFKWITNIRDGRLISSSGMEVANQELFAYLMTNIVNNNLRINFYHQKGHINPSSRKDIDKASRVFSISNYCKLIEIDRRFIQEIAYYNDMVDLFTKAELDSRRCNGEFDTKVTKGYYPFNIDLSTLDISKYSTLIGRR